MNNKGFAISVILYSMIILIMSVLLLVLNLVNSRYKQNKTLKDNVVEKINNEGINTVSEEFERRVATTYLKNKLNSINVGSYSNYYFNGSNPNNYVSFNNELWRFIGVINNNGTEYAKIVSRNYIKINDLDDYTIDNYNIKESNLIKYLNEDYFNSLASKDFVQETKYYVSNISSYINANNVLRSEIDNENEFLSHVGLISISDYVYAALDEGNQYSKQLSNYHSQNNWLQTTQDYFTLSRNNNNLNIVESGGDIYSTPSLSYKVYPALYLKKTIKIKSGSGTIDDPYKLSFKLN